MNKGIFSIFKIKFVLAALLVCRPLLTSVPLIAQELPDVSYQEARASLSTVNVHPVGNTGALTADIPILAPPGRNGMTPDLKLTYNSNKGNGWLGVGWSLGLGLWSQNSVGSHNINKLRGQLTPYFITVFIGLIGRASVPPQWKLCLTA